MGWQMRCLNVKEAKKAFKQLQGADEAMTGLQIMIFLSGLIAGTLTVLSMRF